MYRCVVAMLECPASDCTSRMLPPTSETFLAARVINDLRPLWELAPANPSVRNHVRKRNWTLPLRVTGSVLPFVKMTTNSSALPRPFDSS